MTDFKVHGPFTVPVRAGRKIDRQALNDFWNETVGEELTNSRGCYVFAMAQGRGSLPVYVGMTRRQVFARECLNDRNQLSLNEVLEGRGKLVLHLIAHAGRGRLNESAILELEKYLIDIAADRNPEILNRTASASQNGR